MYASPELKLVRPLLELQRRWSALPDERDDFLKELVARKDKSPQRHLQKLVDFDEEVAAAILKQWIREGANA